MAKKVVVVRVGTKTIRIVHMDNSAVNPTVYGCVRVPTPQGSVVDGEVKNIIDVSRRIKQACQEKGITTKDVIFCLGPPESVYRRRESWRYVSGRQRALYFLLCKTGR